MLKTVALLGALLVACGPAAAPSTTPTPTQAAQSSPTPAATAPASATPAATASPASARADVLLRFAPGTNIADVDDIYDMVTHLKSTPGIHDGFGDENQITVVYDPRLITVDQIRRLLEEMSYPTLPPT